MICYFTSASNYEAYSKIIDNFLFSASVTSPVAPNRYDVDYINDSVFSECGDDPPNRSDRHKRARALYSFTAQNRRYSKYL